MVGGRLLASFSSREQEQVPWRSVFLLRFPAFSQKRTKRTVLCVFLAFQTFLPALNTTGAPAFLNETKTAA